MSAPTVITLFAGIGGLDFGFEAARFRTVAAVEVDAACRQAIADNRSWPITEQDGSFDIVSISTDRILEVAGLRAGEVDALIGGPPCQPFSKSGYWHTGDSTGRSCPNQDFFSQHGVVIDSGQRPARGV